VSLSGGGLFFILFLVLVCWGCYVRCCSPIAQKRFQHHAAQQVRSPEAIISIVVQT
jgi:hypothetical protein